MEAIVKVIDRHLCLGVALISCVLLIGDRPAAAQAASNDVATRTQQLQSLFEEFWQYHLRTDPESATSLGDNRYNDRLTDRSAEFEYSTLEEEKKYLAKFQSIKADGLAAQDATSLELMIRELKQGIEGIQFKPWEMPVNQMGGPHLETIDLISLMPFATVKDYENYLSRLHQIPGMLDQVTKNMRQGLKDHLMPPKYLLEKVVVQVQEVAGNTGEESPFAKPIKNFPSNVPAGEQQRLRSAALDTINKEIIPAYQRFEKFVRTEYAPQGQVNPGVWTLPDGAARYRYNIRRMTTTDMSPEQIHQIGLEQIAKIEAEMLVLAKKLGFNDLAGLNDHIKKDRQLYATSGKQLVDLYTKYSRQMEAKLPEMFGTLPKNKLEIISMDSFRAKSAVPADYTQGASDGSRPGHINVNEYAPEGRLLLNVEAIAYHEGVPGHHLQISIAQELSDLPAFRRNGGYTAYVEGWALYSERLGKEIGFYQDPYSDYGRLENEMWRAIRLVIDTGVHEKHWSREQMVDYFHKYTAMDEPNVQTEVDRYIAWPGQALAYKLGQLDILRLRQEAGEKLGKKFDLKAFHDELLGSGPLPLDVMDSHVETWIAEQAK
jgi:uncharacterized protein (DUF885 family)